MKKVIAQIGEEDPKDTIVKIGYKDGELRIDLGNDLLRIKEEELERANLTISEK